MRQGDESTGLSLIADGTVEIATVDDLGHETVLHNAGPGEVIGDIELLAEMPNLATCRCVTDTVVLIFPRSATPELVRNPTIMRNFARLAYLRMAFINRQHCRSLFMPVEVQIYATLAQLSVHGSKIVHSQAYVADMVGCSRQTVNRVLGELRNDGVVKLSKSRIEIIDRSALLARIS